MKEKIEPTEKEIEAAKLGFEKMARRADELIQKESGGKKLTPEEQKELDLIFNNAAVIDELLQGKTPEEFRK